MKAAVCREFGKPLVIEDVQLADAGPGEVRVKVSSTESYPFFISGGLLEIQPNVVTILADTAIRAKDIDEAAAIEAKVRAEEILADKNSRVDYASAEKQLHQAIMQLRTLDRFRKRGG